MSAPRIRHYLNFIVTSYNYVFNCERGYDFLTDKAAHLHLNPIRNKFIFENLFSYMYFRNFSFIENYFNLLDFTFYYESINLLNFKSLPDQLNHELGCFN